MQVQHIQIANPSDNYLLAATLYAPAETVRGCVVVESAMGVPRRFYDGFARWLSEQRLACVTFDFRGMFDSPALNPGYVRDVSLADWGRRDLESIIGWCEEAFGALPLFAISHSMGGHVIGLTPAAQRFERILLVGCGSIYWGLQPTPLSRIVHAAVWHALVPFTTALCGRFPGRRLKIVCDLPRGVATQWARWCRHPDYVRGVEQDAAFDAIHAPVLSIHFEGDRIISERAVHAFGDYFTRAPVAYLRVQRCALPTGANGHFDFFRRNVAGHFWPETLRWLTEVAPRQIGKPNDLNATVNGIDSAPETAALQLLAGSPYPH
jgi:predicted alpha/beta hydrolase